MTDVADISPPAEKPPELVRRWYALTLMALVSFAVGSALVASTFVAWSLILPGWLPGWLQESFDRWALAAGLLSLGIGILAWTRAWARPRMALPFLAILTGLLGIAYTGYREVHGSAAGTPQTLHAFVGIGSVVCIVFGTAASRGVFTPLVSLFHLGSPIHRLAGVLRYVAYATLALGLLVPFVPTLFGDATPPACALRIAAAGALVFAVPLATLMVASIILIASLRAHRTSVPACTQCGYPRPAGERCPECGAGGGTHASP